MENFFNHNPLKIHLYDPFNNEIKQTFIIVGNVPKQVCAAIKKKTSNILRDYYGTHWKKKVCGGLDTEILITKDDMAEIIDIEPEKTKKRTNKIEYIFDVSIYPEDKFIDLRDKIHVIMDIPLYRQHIFYTIMDSVHVLYRLYTDIMHKIDIRHLNNYKDNVFGIPIDIDIYNNRNSIKIDALDTFTTINNINELYVVDLNDIFENIRGKLNILLHDKYQFDMLFYGFIVKYFPHIEEEIFTTYIENENEILYRYPDIYKNKKNLINAIKIEGCLINKIYSSNNKVINWEKKQSNNIISFITKLVATTKNITGPINIRNLFDKFPVNILFPEIRARIEHEKKYKFRKTYIVDTTITFPNIANDSIIIAISLRKEDRERLHRITTKTSIEGELSKYIYLDIRANGKFYVKISLINESEYDFNNIMIFIEEKVNPVIKIINRLSYYIGGTLKPFNKNNILYESLNISILYKKIISDKNFKEIQARLLEFAHANIISLNPIQGSTISFIFQKGITEFDTESINRSISIGSNFVLTNQYMFLSNNLIKQKWQNLYSGRQIKIFNRTTDIKIDIFQIHSNEFEIFYKYIIFILWSVCPLGNVEITKSIKKPLKRLKEFDPNLYNLKRFGSKNVYSKICQQPNQPLVYTEEEYKKIKNKDNIVPFWNFTFNRPAYYSCNNKKYPHLSFKAGVHPSGYCLPCCDKGAAVAESRRDKINSICRKHFVYKDKVLSDFSKHILAYSQNIEEHRFVNLPKYIYTFTEYIKEDYSFYIYGIPQEHIIYINMSVLNIIADFLKMNMRDTILNIIERIKCVAQNIFSSFYGGLILEYFKTPEELIYILTDIFINKRLLILKNISIDWNKLFIDILAELYNIYFIIFVDEGDEEDLFLFIERRVELLFMQNIYKEFRYILAVRQKKNFYYPIYQVNDYDFKNNEKTAKKIYDGGDNIILAIYNSAKKQMCKEVIYTLNILGDFLKKNNGTIIKKFINKLNYCYAVLIKWKEKELYMPVGLSPSINDGIKISFEPFNGIANYTIEFLYEFIEQFNKFLAIKSKTYLPINIEFFIEYEGQIKSALSNKNLIYYFSPIIGPKYNIAVKHFDYSIINVNKAIYKNKLPELDNRQKLYDESIYNNYLYYFFVVEFVNYIDGERNEEIRRELKELITKTNFKTSYEYFKEKFEELIKDFSKDDITLLNAQLVEFSYINENKPILLKDIDEIKYDFDNITINNLKKLELGEIIIELNNIVKNFIIIDEKSKVKFPNIYVPCSTNANIVDYCRFKKLIFKSEELLKKYIKLLATDIKNPIKNQYFKKEFMLQVIDYFKFDMRPNENIYIYEE